MNYYSSRFFVFEIVYRITIPSREVIKKIPTDEYTICDSVIFFFFN